MEPASKTGPAIRLPLDTDLKRSETADAEPGLHVAHHTAEVESIAEELVIPFLALCNKHTTEDIGVAAEILRAGVHDQIGAEEEGVLDWRRGESAIHDEEGAARVGLLRIRGDVECYSGWVEGCFKEDDIASFEVCRWTVQRELLQACEAGDESDYAVAAMVVCAYGDAAWV